MLIKMEKKNYIENLIPDVLDKSLLKKRFEPLIIQESLKKEAGLLHDEAFYITKKTMQFLITMTKIETITSPMIREVVNSILLQNGYEKARLKYTRIGFPYYDLKEIIEFEERTGEDRSEEILEHIRTEFENVKKLIRITKNGKKYASID